ncbi:hypothetical protein B0O99DRAFT_695480 [Bisporella sp. PMI_857]|nr:hypothetical protein B0O99DRAFT_695480 [Bisporella sp. PMI_857]
MAAPTTRIESLPNEILITILSSFRTTDLLPITTTSPRFYAAIALILESRIAKTASLAEHTLILEVFHPSAKLSTPYFLCKNLGAGSVKEVKEVETLFDAGSTGKIGRLADIYAHFEPQQPSDDNRRARRHPAGGVIPGSSNITTDRQTEFVSQDIHLESHELFSQLCIITNCVKVGPRRGLFTSLINVGDGTIRVWREFLASQLNLQSDSKEQDDSAYKRGLLWADTHEHIGLRVAVHEDDTIMPVLVDLSRDEDTPPVSYTLQYKELVIRATELLLMIEQSIDQEVNHSGKAIVIGSWDQ